MSEEMLAALLELTEAQTLMILAEANDPNDPMPRETFNEHQQGFINTFIVGD